jgi:hypothetical protein
MNHIALETPAGRVVAGCNVDVWLVRHRQLVKRLRGHNLTTARGIQWIRDALSGVDVSSVLGNVGIGSGTAKAASTDTWLGSQVLIDTWTNSQPDGNTLQLQYIIDESMLNGQTITEVAVLTGTSSSNGFAYARYVHQPIVKDSGLQVYYNWQLSWEAAD